MPVKVLDDVLGSLSAAEKALFESTLSKNPELREGWLRQDDYSRKMNDLKAKETTYLEAVAYQERMEPWAEEAHKRIKTLEEAGVIDPEGKELWTSTKQQLEQELELARKQAVGGDMDPAELDKRVREIVKGAGGVSPEEMKALVASEARKMAEETFDSKYQAKETDFNEKTIPFVTGFAAANTLAALEYEKVTGKPWTADVQKEFFGLMSKEQNFDPYVMREKFLEPHKRVKDSEAEIERRVQMELAKRGAPGGGGESYIPPSAQKGNIALMMERSAEGQDFESLIQAGAAKAATELRAEGK